MRRIAIGALVLLLALAAVLLWRAARLPSRQVAVDAVNLEPVSADEVASHLAQSVRFRTISHSDPAENDPEAFRAFHRFLARTYPRTHGALARETVNELSLLYTWAGSDPGLAPEGVVSAPDVKGLVLEHLF